jgi:hypothetical protein
VSILFPILVAATNVVLLLLGQLLDLEVTVSRLASAYGVRLSHQNLCRRRDTQAHTVRTGHMRARHDTTRRDARRE